MLVTLKLYLNKSRTILYLLFC